MYSDLHLEFIFVHSDVYKGLIKVGEKLTKQTLSQLIRLYIVFCVAEKPRREKKPQCRTVILDHQAVRKNSTLGSLL